MSTDYIKSRTRTLHRQYQSQDLYPTGTRIRSKLRQKNYSDKWEKNKVKGIRQIDVPGNEGQDPNYSTTSEVFKRIVKNNNNIKGNSGKLSCYDPPFHDSLEHKDKECLIRPFTNNNKMRQRRRRPLDPKKLATENLSQKRFSLFPSSCYHLSPLEEKELRLREMVGYEVSVRGQQQVKNDLRRLCNVGTKLVITKRFEFFPTRLGDHNLCYFSLKNDCRQLVAYQISTTCPKFYSILPDTSYIPSGKTLNVCIKSLTPKIRLEDMETCQLIFQSWFIPSAHTQLDRLSKDFQPPPSSQLSTSSFPLSTFLVHTCAILPSKFTDHHSHPIIKSIPPPPPQSSIDSPRLAILTSRNYGEKVFAHLNTQFHILRPQLKRLRRVNFYLSVILNIISYSMYVGLLLVALHLATFGTVQLKNSYLNPDYSNSPVLLRWFYQIRDCFKWVTQNHLSDFLMTIPNFVRHPLSTFKHFLWTINEEQVEDGTSCPFVNSIFRGIRPWW